jgi:hypothetical protein
LIKLGPARIVLLSVAVVVSVIGGAAAVSAVRTGNEGCTPGFWKNHTEAWEEYAPTDLISSVFNFDAGVYTDLAGDTLLEALNYPETQNGSPQQLLLKQAVAAILNAANEGVGYPYRRFGDPGNIIPTVNALLSSGNEDAMLDFKDILDAANNLGSEFCD